MQLNRIVFITFNLQQQILSIDTYRYIGILLQYLQYISHVEFASELFYSDKIFNATL